jgi:hypothetical protein
MVTRRYSNQGKYKTAGHNDVITDLPRMPQSSSLRRVKGLMYLVPICFDPASGVYRCQGGLLGQLGRGDADGLQERRVQPGLRLVRLHFWREKIGGKIIWRE